MDYFEWLMTLVGPLGSSHTIALEIAFSVRFYEVVPNDVNRADEGLELRDRYIKEVCSDLSNMDACCSILEMMIALSIRMNDVAYDYKNPNRSIYWFECMFHNLDIMEYVDQVMDRFAEEHVRMIFTKVTDRHYSENGVGSLFPLTGYGRKQPDTEIWYQMMLWLDENVLLD